MKDKDLSIFSYSKKQRVVLNLATKYTWMVLYTSFQQVDVLKTYYMPTSVPYYPVSVERKTKINFSQEP
jgi:hypothetical protein